MTDIVVLGSTHTDPVAHVEKAPRRGETVPGRDSRPGASASTPYRSGTEERHTS
ncbi:hypothetical protein [Streptomyces sp. NPDC048734]|uniref:hypothetical protein n=1 Tax=Streptomyces sp. NPDC048734 TaxID=3365590 RepID=UPI00371C1B48